MIHIVTGLPGTGKTEVARLLCQAVDGFLVQTDDVKQALYPNGEVSEHGDFTSEQLDVVYRTLPVLALYLARALSEGQVVFEGCFRAASQRQSVVDIATAASQRVGVIWVKAPETLVQRWITQRYELGVHQARFETHMAVARVYESPAGAYVIENQGSLEDLRRRVEEYAALL